MRAHGLDHRLSAAAQCDFVDRSLAAIGRKVQTSQHDLLIAGSAHHLPRCGLMAAQVPRGMQLGMAIGRYPTQAIRDVVVAVAQVVVDDEIVEPLVRMGRRAPRGRAGGVEGGAGRLYENGLVLMWGTGQAVLAAPLNAVMLMATMLGASAGAVAGVLMAVAVGVCTPRRLLGGLCPALAVLTHLTSNYELTQKAARLKAQHPHGPPPERLLALWPRIKEGLEHHDAEILRLCPQGDAVARARALETELVATPTLAQLTGLGPYPLGNVDRLLAARAEFDAAFPSMMAHAEPAATVPDEFDTLGAS